MIFTYKFPKCDCNSILKKKTIKHYREYDRTSVVFSLLPKILRFNGSEIILICPECKREYESKTDKYGRYIRGGIYNDKIASENG